MSVAIVIQFSEVDEFLAELGEDRALVERGIVHVTKLGRPGPAGVTHVLVHAGAIVDHRPVILERYVGTLWGTGQDQEVQDAATALVDRLERGVAGLGLTTRSGAVELREGTAR